MYKVAIAVFTVLLLLLYDYLPNKTLSVFPSDAVIVEPVVDEFSGGNSYLTI